MHEKEQAFRDASYYVDAPAGRIHFRVGVHCPALDALLAELGVTEAAFITACNPGATARDDSINRPAQQALEDTLRAQGYRLLPGAGAESATEPRTGTVSWQPEASCLVAGLSVSAARKIASAWDQVAWVHILAGKPPQLRFSEPAQEWP